MFKLNNYVKVDNSKSNNSNTRMAYGKVFEFNGCGRAKFNSNYSIIVIRNGKIVWKHGPNRPFFLYNLSSKNY